MRHDERGQVSTWMALASLAMVLIVGIAVDLSGQVLAKQRAADLAAQAARVGGNQLEVSPAMRGRPVTVDPQRARAAAKAYIANAGATGTVTVTTTQITVTVHDTYQPLFLSAAGLGTQQVTGEATARLARAVNGAER